MNEKSRMGMRSEEKRTKLILVAGARPNFMKAPARPPGARSSPPRPSPRPTGLPPPSAWLPTAFTAATPPWAPSCGARKPTWESPRPSRLRPTSWPDCSTSCSKTGPPTWTRGSSTMSALIGNGPWPPSAARSRHLGISSWKSSRYPPKEHRRETINHPKLLGSVVSMSVSSVSVPIYYFLNEYYGTTSDSD